MTPGAPRSERSRVLLETAAGLGSADEQREFLAAVCPDDPGLLAELEQTLTLTRPSAAEEVGDPSAALAAGGLVAGRFQIIRKLGQGGMGSVYEALDTKLGEPRALKFPKPGHDRRLPHEARAALRVTDDNICRIYEIHSTADCDFLSMELIDGPTLLDRCRRQPPSAREAVEIARQLCRGLEAIHRARILHHDLKGNNVILAHRSDDSLRVVITDFGLARRLDCGTAGAEMGGTPNYIAPERWKGEPAAPASDVYSLGVILYEMLTGRLPFPRGTPWSQRLAALPAAPAGPASNLDPRWNRIVLRCLEPDPRRRFASAADVLKALGAAFRPVYRRPWAIAAATLALAVSPVAAFRDRIWPPPLVRLAILPFTGSTGDPSIDIAARGALYDVARQLESLGAKSQRLVAIPVEDALRYDAATPERAAKRLGATHALSGSVAAAPGGFRVHESVSDIAGATLQDFSGEFRRADLGALPSALTGVVTSAFRLARAPQPSIAPAAYEDYAAGLAALRAAPPQPAAAVASFERAVAADSGSAAIYANLAEAYLRQSDATHDPSRMALAKTAAARAVTLQPDFAPALLAEGAIEEREGRGARAVELFRRSAELEPRNPEAWRRTGLAMQHMGRDREALDALQRAVRVAPDYFNPHLSLGFMYFRVAQLEGAARELRAAARLAPAHPDVFAGLGAVLIAMGRDQEAEAALRQALDIRETRPTLNNLGVLLRYHHRDGEAAAMFQRALSLGQDDSGLRLNLGNALRAAGSAAEAQPHFRQAEALARAALRVNPQDSVARARLSFALVRLGQFERAADEALQASRLAPTDYAVVFWCVMTMESLSRRSDALALLASAPRERLNDLRRQTDLADLTRDSRFTALLDSAQPSTRIPERK